MLLDSNQNRHCQGEKKNISFIKCEKSQPGLLQNHQGFPVLMLALFPCPASITASKQLGEEESV